MDNDGQRATALRFIISVFKRPGMHTLCGTFEEAYAFLHGYYGGQCSIDPNSEQAYLWFQLGEMLRVQLGVDTHEAFAKFRSGYPDSDQACKAIVKYAETNLDVA